MNLNKKDLKKIQYRFNSVCNRLLQANFEDYSTALKRFLTFINDTEIIYEHVINCGSPEFDVANEVNEVASSFGRHIFDVGESEAEETRNIYAILSYISDNEISVAHSVGFGYSSSKKFQDKVEAFNHRFVMILMQNLEEYLTQIGIDMGVDEKTLYSIVVESGGQAIVAEAGSSVVTINNSTINVEVLNGILEKVKYEAVGFDEDVRQEVDELVEVVKSEMNSDKPKKSMVRTALNALKGLKGTAEFSAAVAELIQFLQTVVG